MHLIVGLSSTQRWKDDEKKIQCYHYTVQEKKSLAIKTNFFAYGLTESSKDRSKYIGHAFNIFSYWRLFWFCISL